MSSIVQSNSGYLVVKASADDTYRWAHRAGAWWPCSVLSGHRFRAEFEPNGDLVGLTVDGRDAPQGLASDELDAITSDLIRAKYPDHPAIR